MRVSRQSLPLVLAIFALSTIGAVALSASPAQGHWHGGIYVGIGLLWWGVYPYAPYPAPYYYPYPPYYAYPNIVAVQPPLYAEAPIDWYYCAPSKTFYPYVQTCAEPWIKVPPRLP